VRTPSIPITLPPALSERLARVRLLCLDVDGVLTDGHLYWADPDAVLHAEAL